METGLHFIGHSVIIAITRKNLPLMQLAAIASVERRDVHFPRHVLSVPDIHAFAILLPFVAAGSMPWAVAASVGWLATVEPLIVRGG
jgi:hypothetical protein